MPVIPIDLGFSSWGGPNAGSFRPNGRLQVHGHDIRYNPVRYGGKTGGKQDVWSARLFVGLNVEGEPRWSMEDVVKIVQAVRTKQTGQADSSFILQRGLYTQTVKGQAEVIDESSVQVAITNLPHWGIGKKEFKDQMIELAEKVAAMLKQDTVILEIQKNGLVKFSWTIEP